MGLKEGSYISPTSVSFVGLVVLLSVGCIMLLSSWQKWADVIIDYGEELYVPWQINQGKILYRDIYHNFGPLSQYLNAALFRSFGTEIATLALFNIFLIAALTYIIFRFFRDNTDAITAISCGAVFLSIFAFSQYYISMASFNFVCPYAHEVAHGVFLSFACLSAFGTYVKKRKKRWILAVGVLLGLTFLTKAEIFIALLSGIMLGGIFLVIAGGISLKNISDGIRKLGMMCMGFILPFAAFFRYFSKHMPVERTVEAMLMPYGIFFQKALSSGEYYARVLGIYDLSYSVKKLMVACGIYVAGIILFAALAFIKSRIANEHNKRAFVLALLLAAVLFSLFDARTKVVAFTINHMSWRWRDFAMPLPLVAAGFVIYSILNLLRFRTDRAKVCRMASMLAFSVFALVMLSKIILNVHVFHYGFALAFPAFLLLVVLIMHNMPAVLGRLYGGTHYTRAMAIILLGVIVVAHVNLTQKIYSRKIFPVGSGGDTIYALDPRILPIGVFVNEVTKAIKRNTAEEDTLAAFPSGAMINYMSRRSSPIKYIEFTPPNVALFTEEAIMRDLEENVPDYIVLLNRDTSEHGLRSFGLDYARSVFGWISKNYETVRMIGSRPGQDGKYAMAVLKYMNER